MTVKDLQSAGRRKWRSASCEDVFCCWLCQGKIRSETRGVAGEVWVCVGDLVLMVAVGRAEALQRVGTAE